MRISALIAACGTVAAFISSAAIAQATTDTAASQQAAPTKKELRAENHQLAKAVRRALYSTKGLAANNIAILVKGGTVSLVGTVPVESQIAIAGDVAKRVPHVDAVDNRLIVAEEGGGQ